VVSTPSIAATKPLLTATEAAQLAGISRATFHKLIRTEPEDSALRRAVIHTLGARILIRRYQLERWLTGATTSAPESPHQERRTGMEYFELLGWRVPRATDWDRARAHLETMADAELLDRYCQWLGYHPAVDDEAKAEAVQSLRVLQRTYAGMLPFAEASVLRFANGDRYLMVVVDGTEPDSIEYFAYVSLASRLGVPEALGWEKVEMRIEIEAPAA
jgi:hypothetical protein